MRYQNSYMHKLFLGIAIIFFPFLSLGQSNYKPGYIVNLTGDTLKGYIDYREWEMNPKSFNFKNSLAGNEIQKITVDNTKALGITNFEYYEKYIVRASKGTIETSRLSDHLDTSFYNTTAFLKIVTDGKNIALYSLSDEIKIRFYIRDKKDGQVTELGYYSYITDSKIQTKTPYLRQLTVLVLSYKPGDNNLVNEVQRAGYSEADIKSIVKTINGGENATVQTNAQSEIRFFAGAGVKSSKLTFGADNQTFFPPTTHRSNTSPTVSGGVDFILNKNTKKITLRFEATFSNSTYNFYYAGSPSDLKVAGSLDLKQFNVAIAPQLVYNFYSANTFNAFIDIGVAFNYSSYNNYNYISYFSDGTTESLNKAPAFNKLWYSFPIKAGVLLSNRIEVYGAYSFPTTLNHISNVTTLQAGVNYMF